MKKMNSKIKKLWVNALRSGKFRQGQLRLVKKDENKHLKYCCLGVLCKLYIQETGDNIFSKDNYTFAGERYDLPKKVKKWAGLSSDQINEDTIVSKSKNSDDGYCVGLIAINDDTEIGFKGIADIIEKQL